MIPFVDLQKQYQIHHEAFEKAIFEVASSCSFILGPQVSRFEQRFAEFIGVSDAVGVANGTDALRIACQALNLGVGDEILMPANTFIATAIGAWQAGAIPVAVDVHEDSYLIDLKSAEKRITKKTKAIMPVHLYGQSVDMTSVMEFAKTHNLTVIEDACQSHGSKWNGKCTGAFGQAGCFSFYPGKNLGGFGDGGMVVTNDRELANKIRLLRNYGSTKKYIHEIPAGNSRLDSIQAAVLNVKLDLLPEWNLNRFKAACRYTNQLQGIKNIKTPSFNQNDHSSHIFHLYVIQCERRDQLLGFLQDRGIQAQIHYPVPLHKHEASPLMGMDSNPCPTAEKLAQNIISLPIFPEITNDQIDTVVNGIKEFYQ